MGHSAKPFRIGLTCDIYRFVPQAHTVANFQNRNLAWLHALLADTLNTLPSVRVSKINAPETVEPFKRALNNDGAYAEYEAGPEDAWARNYDKIDDALFPDLLAELAEQDLIIGFEMPPGLRTWLNGQKLRYVNLYIHPLRFLPDICFGATTNDAALSECIDGFACPEGVIGQQVGRFKGLFARQRLPQTQLPPGTPILIGQTAGDSVLLVDGVLADWTHYETEIREQLNGFDSVAFLEHPYRAHSWPIISFLRDRLGKTVITVRGNSYGMLFSNPDTPKVLTLSSSLGVEAAAMGHNCTFLLSDPRDKFRIKAHEIPARPLIGHALFDAELWKGLIDSDHRKQVLPKPVAFPLGENYVRNSLDSWSFKTLQYGLKVEPAKKVISPRASITSEHLLELAAAAIGADFNEQLEESDYVLKAAQSGTELRLLQGPLLTGTTREINLSPSDFDESLSDDFIVLANSGLRSKGATANIALPVSVEPGQTARVHIEISLKLSPEISALSPVIQISKRDMYSDATDIGYMLFRSTSEASQVVAFDVLTRDTRFDLILSMNVSATSTDLANGLWFGVDRLCVTCVDQAVETGDDVMVIPQVWGVGANKALVAPARDMVHTS